MGDIDFSQVSNWGSVDLQSGAELNGNGYSINNLVINDTTNSDMRGLFVSNYGTIKNLNLNNVSIDKGEEEMYVCGLTSTNYGTIYNCSVSGSINGGYTTGGLVGDNSGTITDCSSSVTVTGTDSTGGLAGYNGTGTITDCSSSGTVTGTDSAGGLVGNNGGGTITSCSSSATVTGTYNTGGLVGNNSGNIDKSYSTGDVSGEWYVGGLVGGNYTDLTNSYALGNVSGTEFVGGFAGEHYGGTISTSYSTGTVTGIGDEVGGFVGKNGYYEEEYGDEDPGYINNSYATSELDFYGDNVSGEITNSHGRTSQTGVTAHDASWFENGDNLSFLGEEYDTTKIPPDLKSNSRFKPEPTPVGTETVFQIGANSGEENTLTIDTGFSLNGLKANVLTIADGEKTLNDIDEALENISTFRATIGATQNRLESVSQSLLTRKNNMEASHSTIMDTDYGFETSKLVKNQILQNVTASLLAQANSNPEIALRLL